MSTTLNDMDALLSVRYHGVRKVANEYGLICVYVEKYGVAQLIKTDFMLSGGFSNVNVQENHVDGGFFVVGCPSESEKV
jgi:hypothetical protein